MKKIAQGIVRFRKLILTVAFLLLIPSAIGAVATRINYDILTYLPQDLDSMIGEVALEDDFHLASTGMITVEGLPTNELIAMKKDIEAVPGVTQTFWLSDVIDPSIPTEMLPADVQQFMFGKNDSTMLIVRFDAPSASDETMNAVSQIETLLRKDCFFGGMSVILQDTKALVNQEMPFYILIAVGASLLVLFLSLESTITPLLFMLGLLFPIAYNFGTNIFLGQISYITERTESAAYGVRWHHHVIMSGDGLTREEIEEKWTKRHGGFCNTRRAQPTERHLSGFARYLTISKLEREGKNPQQKAVGRSWGSSIGLKEPAESVADKKISVRKAGRVAETVADFGRAKEIFEKLYPGCELLEIGAKKSRWASGVYVHALMRRVDETGRTR